MGCVRLKESDLGKVGVFFKIGRVGEVLRGELRFLGEWSSKNFLLKWKFGRGWILSGWV